MRKRLVVLRLATMLVILLAGVGIFGHAWAGSAHPAGGTAGGKAVPGHSAVHLPVVPSPLFHWKQQTELTAGDGVTGDNFGYPVAINGNTAVVGAAATNNDTGTAYIFVRSSSTDMWSQQAELTASDGVAGDIFGYGVAISGDTMVVGAPGDNSAAGVATAGAACVFVRSGTSWSQQAKLSASDGVSGDFFGFSVALSGDGSTALIGAVFSNTSTGSAYIFEHSRGEPWSQQTKLTASNGKTQDDFGVYVSLSVDGFTALIGASGKNTSTGAAYVFVHDEMA